MVEVKFKAKGRYEWRDLPHHKNHSALIIKMAAEEYFLNDVDPEEFIRNHKDPYDFMLRTKVPRSSRLVLVDNLGNETQVQNICRYYVSTDGGTLIKVMPPLKETQEVQVWVNDETLEEVRILSPKEAKAYEKKGFRLSHVTEEACPERRFEIEANWKCKVTNDMDNFAWDIDYQYYIEKVWKLVHFADGDDDENTTDDNE